MATSEDPSNLEAVIDRNPFCRPDSVELIHLQDRFRDRSVKQSITFPLALQELGEDKMLGLIKEGYNELVERGETHRRLYREIAASAGKVNEETSQERHFLDSPFGAFYEVVSAHESFPSGSDNDVLQTLKDTEIHPTATDVKTFRRALELRALTLIDRRSQAPTKREQKLIGSVGIDYVRGNVDLESLTQMYKDSLLKHYGLTNREAIIHLTHQGIAAPKLALLSLFQRYPEAEVYAVGDMYFEIEDFINDLKELGIATPQINRVSADGASVAAAIKEAADTKRPVIFSVDPIGSSYNMSVTDLGEVIKTASAHFRSEVPFFLAADLTTAAGMYKIAEQASEIIGQSNVNLLQSESLHKYFQWGTSIPQGGVVIGLGPELKPEGELAKHVRTVYKALNWEPDIDQVAYYPPVDQEYMEYRARIIERNALNLIAQIQQQFGDKVKISYPGLRAAEADVLKDIGFKGPYFFIELPAGAPAKFLDHTENHQEDDFGFIESGASFGYSRTRVENFTGFKPNFSYVVRVVPGIEDVWENYMVSCNLRRILAEVLKS